MFFGLNALWVVFPGWCIYEIALDSVGRRATTSLARAPSDAVGV